ncbi:hypothetical protein NP233_g12130 [Leucocoprinus birnbaumii]|uniref:SAP domain-containing protein n=1 Tax=Leucocoprinus birnbaumii TaxID=56174 RepID=A0AAD5VG87_9AGAR|nr:hypothetical protein NP233_g12130 [Leucocoprinus birnbaumii]
MHLVGNSIPPPPWPNLAGSRDEVIYFTLIKTNRLQRASFADLATSSSSLPALVFVYTAFALAFLSAARAAASVPIMPKAGPGVELILPCPDLLKDAEGRYETETVHVSKLQAAPLRAVCARLKLDKGGKKRELIDRLIEFSKRPEEWETHFLNTTNKARRRTHLGPQDGPHKSAPKPSAVLRQEMLGPQAEETTQVERSRDMRTERQKDWVFIWAAANAVRYQDAEDAVHSEAAESHPAQPAPASNLSNAGIQGAGRSSQPSNSAPPPLYGTAQYQPLPVQGCIPPVPQHLASYRQNPHESSAHPIPPHPFSAVPPEARPPNNLTAFEAPRTIYLGSGEPLTFHTSDVPSIPFVSFADDIPRLGRMWDDTAPDWNGDGCILHIKSRAIALKYWPAVFKRAPGNRWAGIKKYWNEWQACLLPHWPFHDQLLTLPGLQFVALRWNASTPQDFWHEFSQGGHPMSWSQIVATLREQRKRAQVLQPRNLE